MGYLEYKSVYLAGPIHSCNDDGIGWRSWITPRLKKSFNLHVEDPSKKSVNGVCEVADDKKRFRQLAFEENWKELKEQFYPIVRKDLRCVDKADFLIAVYDPSLHMFGTIHEIIEASHQKKPILVKYDRSHLKEFNPWITCLVKDNWLFAEWDDMFKYMEKINSGDIETSHWGLD